MEGSEAALTVVTNPEKLESLQQRVGRAPGPPRPFEALVKLTAFAGAAAKYRNRRAPGILDDSQFLRKP